MLKAKYIKRRFLWRTYKKEIATLTGFAVTLFVAISLGTYNAHDSSWAYASSPAVPITNLGGVVGAQIAAFCFYLFGSATLLLLGVCAFTLYLFIKNIPLRAEADRYGAFALLMLAATGLSTASGMHLWGALEPGGFIGARIFWLLHRWFDTLGSLLFLYTLLAISVIVITQLSWVRFAYQLMRTQRMSALRKAWWVCMRIYTQRALAIGARMLAACVSYGYRSWIACARFFDVLSIPHEYDAPDQEYLSADSLHADEFWHAVSEPELVSATVTAEPATTQEHDGAQDMPVVHEVPKPTVTVPALAPYKLPSLSLFARVKDQAADAQMMKEFEVHARTLEEKLRCFGVSGSVSSIKCGPVVTLFEYVPDIDSKISKIIALEDDLALALKAVSIRIIAPIPGRAVVGFEVSNERRKSVVLSDVIRSDEYAKFAGGLPLILGKDTVGNNVVVDLVRMPHLLVAGSTGSGKSVALNTILISLLCARTPDELRLVLIDPKRLEFAPYADVAHLLFPIATQAKDAAPLLAWVVSEMEKRYKHMAERGARNLADYNKMVGAHEKQPYIVVIIDELSDLMMTAGREVESLIVRIAQMARAAGIHMIVATQRPSVDVITGLIKANFPSRVSFRVTSKVDSRTILDCSGADKLLGRGDMLFLDSADSLLKRVHGAYVSDQEIQKVTDHIRGYRSPQYLHLINELPKTAPDMADVDDQLYESVLLFLNDIEEVSISLLQRKFRIGYNRSARIIELLESRGLVMPSEGGKTRKVVR